MKYSPEVVQVAVRVKNARDTREYTFPIEVRDAVLEQAFRRASQRFKEETKSMVVTGAALIKEDA